MHSFGSQKGTRFKIQKNWMLIRTPSHLTITYQV